MVRRLWPSNRPPHGTEAPLEDLLLALQERRRVLQAKTAEEGSHILSLDRMRRQIPELALKLFIGQYECGHLLGTSTFCVREVLRSSYRLVSSSEPLECQRSIQSRDAQGCAADCLQGHRSFAQPCKASPTQKALVAARGILPSLSG